MYFIQQMFLIASGFLPSRNRGKKTPKMSFSGPTFVFVIEISSVFCILKFNQFYFNGSRLA